MDIKLENIEVVRLKIAICDDEEKERFYIRKLIEKQDADCHITEFSSGRELLLFQEQSGENDRQMDIIFLDISMEDMDGMTAAKQLRNRMEDKKEAVWGSLPLLIFVSGYTEYMPEAFLVNAFGYIVKPIRESEFERVFSQALRECRCLAEKRRKQPKEILVRNKMTIRNVPAEDIYYIESRSRKVILYLAREKIEYYDKISELEQELKPDFFRVHKGYLVNMKYVERYDRSQIRMKNGDLLLISKYKYQDFVKAYLEYISEVR